MHDRAWKLNYEWMGLPSLLIPAAQSSVIIMPSTGIIVRRPRPRRQRQHQLRRKRRSVIVISGSGSQTLVTTPLSPDAIRTSGDSGILVMNALTTALVVVA